MKAIFEKKYNLRSSDFDLNGNILPQGVLEILQDSAGRHSVSIGASVFDLDKKDLMWVVAKIRFKIINMPKMYQTVNVKTWPIKPTKIIFRRECLITDEQGNELIRGSSEWLAVSKEKRKIVSASGIYNLAEDEYVTDILFDEKPEKLKKFDKTAPGYVVSPKYSDIDLNGHVNNTKYAGYVVDTAFDGENRLNYTDFQIEYRKEILKDDNIEICIKPENGGIYAMGLNQSGEAMFLAKLGD